MRAYLTYNRFSRLGPLLYSGQLQVPGNEIQAFEFLRHKEIYQSDEQEKGRARPFRHALAHRLDEFPVGYSLTSCSPAELASASPTGLIVSNGSVAGKHLFSWSEAET